MEKYTGRYAHGTSPRRKRFSIYWMLPILIVAGAMPELLLHFLTAKGQADLWNGGVALSLLFSVVSGFVVFGIALAFPWKKVRFWIGFSYCLVMLLLCGSQLVYFGVFGTFYSAFSAGNAGQVLQFWAITLQSIWKNLFWLILMALPLIGICILRKRFYQSPARKGQWQMTLVLIVLAAAMQWVLTANLAWFGGTENTSPYDLYHHNADSYLSINRLGVTTAFRLDLTRLITGNQPQGSIDIDGPVVTMPQETNPQGSETQPEETEPPIDTSPNVLDLDFDSLIAGETDKKLLEVHKFFQSQQPTNKNEKTGMFEGCNLVMITAEAFSPWFITEELTPTLYKMLNGGFNFTDYYVPLWGTSTTDGEYCFLTGTVPKPGVWSFYRSADNAMPLTMSMQLKEQGYNAYAYHGHTYTYYDRDQYLTNIGYYYRGYGGSSDGKTNGLPVKYTWPESDVQVVDVSTADYVDKSPFVAYYMSISGHMEFSFSGNYISWQNKKYVQDLPYSDAVKAYIACQLEFEFSMKLLMERLEEAGQLDNTVFVITADHYPYGLTNEEYSELFGHPLESNFELYKNGCIIYKPGMTPETITKPCSHFDILPTISNLFGLEYDSRLYMGKDVFSDAPGLVMFPNYSWITDYASYNASTKEVINRTEQAVTDEYVKSVSRDLANRFAVSIRILDYDYWSILFN